MHWSERISYYVYGATEMQLRQGVAGKSQPYKTFIEALDAAREELAFVPEIVENQSIRVRIERHCEFFDGYHNEWCIDWKKDGGRQVTWDSAKEY